MIFWKHLKGLNANNIYSFLRFDGSGTTYTTKSYDNLPKIVLSNNTTYGEGTYVDYGHILTTDVVNGFFLNEFTFRNIANFHNAVHLISNNPGNSLNIYFNANKWLLESGQTIKINNDAEIGGKTSITDTTAATNSSTGALVVTGGIGVGNNLWVENEVIIGDKCEANYFNATSDYRAKKDFKLLDIDALELVKKVQLYSFKYKESNQPSIGIIAQDVKDININGFDLVDNKDATGENFDYMSIHESKLIYILWKAIQEQQKEIEELRQQLNK